MALKSKLASLDGVPEALQTLYIKQADGTFVLDAEVEDHPSVRGMRSALDSEREERRKAKEALEKFKDIDPDEYRGLKGKEREMAEAKLLAEGKVKELVELQVKELRATTEREKKALQDQVAASTAQLNVLLIDNAVQQAATKLGVRPTALEDVSLRARATFKLQDGKAVPFDANGNPIYGKDATAPQSVEEWMGNLATTAVHLFGENKGGGAPGGGSGPARPGFISKAQMSQPGMLEKVASGEVKVQ